MSRKIHPVFKALKVSRKVWASEDGNKMLDREVTVSVWLDLDLLAGLAIRASRNKNQLASDGALFVEVRAVVDKPIRL